MVTDIETGSRRALCRMVPGMAKTPVTAATGPVQIVDGGQQVSLPLSSLFFEDGKLMASGSVYAAHQPAFDPWLQYLAHQGLITPAAALPARSALLITAKDPGSIGNDISLVIANVGQDPSDLSTQVFDATLTQVDSYPGLTPQTLGGVIGTSAAPTGATRPGLVWLSSTSVPGQPAAGTYAPVNQVVTVPDDGGVVAFVLTYRPIDQPTTARVQISSAGGGTFSLVATWTRTKPGIHVTDLVTAPFSDFITVTKPDGSSPSNADVPAPGTVVLSGGSDSATAKPASATAAAE
jgi:hypothetical protein